MRKMKQLLAAGLMMSMIAATSAGTSVFASTPEVVETNESTKTESSKETAQKVMDQYQKIEGIDSEKTILGADFYITSKMLDGTRYGKIIKEMPLTISFRM